MNAPMSRVYTRRRITVVLVALLVVALMAYGICGAIRGSLDPRVLFGNQQASSQSSSAQGAGSSKGAGKQGKKTAQPKSKASKKASDAEPIEGSGDDKASPLPHCTGNNVRLELASKHPVIGVGESVDFTATIRYVSSASRAGSQGCIVDGSDASRILTISSGGDTIWRSDVCPTDPRKLDMYKTSDMNKDQQKMTWNADQTGNSCQDDSQLPRVDRGTYAAQLQLKEHPSVKSNTVTVTVE